MRGSLRALLSHVIDYAGMFPPAQLPLEEAATKYLDYQESAHAWMLGRFVCTAASLPQLQNSRHWAGLRRYPLSLIGPADPERDDYIARLSADLEAVKASRAQIQKGDGEAQPWSFEFKFSPSAIVRKPNAVGIFEFAGTADECVDVFLEVPLQRESDLRKVAAHVGTSSGDWGLKFRTGPTADLIPAAKHLASAIRLCCQYGIRFKVTAGLHQPLRQFDQSLGTLAHGFLNVLCAAALSHACRISDEEIAEVLKEKSPSAFAFTDDSLRWRAFNVTVPDIEAARRASMVSFGSCSFEEPVEGLKALGLIK